MSWSEQPLVGFDTETTGVDPQSSRLVTAAIIVREDGADRKRTWLANPGVEIPVAASQVHGVTTEYARAHGADPKQVLEEVASLLTAHLLAGHPVVAFNAKYDLELMEAELTRHGLPTLTQRLGRLLPVIDPLVLDRALDRWRKGKRTLSDVAALYGVRVPGEAHNADVDVLLALGVAQEIARRYPNIAQLSALELHHFQVDAYRDWAQGFIQFRRHSNPQFTMSTKWPLQD
ncbi:MAG: exonuclease domain-containing protein [Actinomycetaceae bacterium]|nr:exonuclease domain-containing protein [Actinomycetaceae bacterium]